MDALSYLPSREAILAILANNWFVASVRLSSYDSRGRFLSTRESRGDSPSLHEYFATSPVHA